MAEKEQEVDDLKKEIDFLWQFWLNHSCEKCKDDKKTRLPTKRFPMLARVLEEIT